MGKAKDRPAKENKKPKSHKKKKDKSVSEYRAKYK